MDREHIREAAEALIAEAGLAQPPVRTPALCRVRDVEMYGDRHDLRGNVVFDDPLPDGVDGVMIAYPYFRMIRFRTHSPSGRMLPSTRQRFSIAHELGHLELHCNGCGCLFLSGGMRYERIPEDEANYFAACLLMPERWMRDLVAAGSSFDDLRDRFWVSRSAMRQRLRELRLRVSNGPSVILYDADDVSDPFAGYAGTVTGDPYEDYLLMRSRREERATSRQPAPLSPLVEFAPHPAAR